MEKTFFKRSAAGIIALCLVCSAAACGKNEKQTEVKAPQKASEVMQHSFRPLAVDTDIDINYLEQMKVVGDNEIIIVGEDSNGNPKCYVTNSELTDVTDITPDIKLNDDSYARAVISDDGTIYVVKNEVDYGDAERPDYDDPDFDPETFDFEAFEAAAKHTTTVYTLDKTGKITAENEVKDISKLADEDDESGSMSVGQAFSVGDKLLCMSYAMETKLFVLDPKDGSIGTIFDSSDDNYIVGAATDTKGDLVCVKYGMRGMEVCKVDIESGSFTDCDIELDISIMNNIQSLATGSGDYTLYLNCSDSLRGIKEDGTIEEIINWADSDVNGQTINSLVQLPDGEFLIYINDYESDTHSFFRMTERDMSELDNTTMVTVAVMYNDPSIAKKVTQFNQNQTEYRIKTVDYSKYDDYDEESGTYKNSPMMQLKNDILTGKAPDMIVTYDRSVITSLASKGIYADLGQFLDKDDTLKREDIMPNVLEACTFNGKVYTLAPSFSVVSYAVKKKYYDKVGWTVDDMINLYNEHSDMQLLDYAQSNEDILELLLATSSGFIDYENTTCHFDSEDFIKLIEFCKQFPSADEAFSWSDESADAMEYYNDMQVMCRNDKALISLASIYQLRMYKHIIQATFGEDVTLVGAPGAKGIGGIMTFDNMFAILDNSPSKQACWDFIKQFFTESSYDDEYMLPSLVSAFDKKADESMSKPYYIDEKGEKQEYDDTEYIKNKEIKIDPLTQEERDYIAEYIKGCTDVVGDYPEEIINILREEILKYFADECSAEDAAKIIQNRISILISEES